MKNLMKKIRKSNKGFTLVELIIVVAIIAVLSAVVAPQYIKYVERSRQGVDASTLEEVRHAVEVEAAVMETIAANTTVSVAGSNGAISGAGSFADADDLKPITDVVNTSVALKSKAAKTYTWVITVTTDGVVAWQDVASSDADSVTYIKSLQSGALAVAGG